MSSFFSLAPFFLSFSLINIRQLLSHLMKIYSWKMFMNAQKMCVFDECLIYRMWSLVASVPTFTTFKACATRRVKRNRKTWKPSSGWCLNIHENASEWIMNLLLNDSSSFEKFVIKRYFAFLFSHLFFSHQRICQSIKLSFHYQKLRLSERVQSEKLQKKMSCFSQFVSLANLMSSSHVIDAF